jgi:hypothetical protein
VVESSVVDGCVLGVVLGDVLVDGSGLAAMTAAAPPTASRPTARPRVATPRETPLRRVVLVAGGPNGAGGANDAGGATVDGDGTAGSTGWNGSMGSMCGSPVLGIGGSMPAPAIEPSSRALRCV